MRECKSALRARGVAGVDSGLLPGCKDVRMMETAARLYRLVKTWNGGSGRWHCESESESVSPWQFGHQVEEVEEETEK